MKRKYLNAVLIAAVIVVLAVVFALCACKAKTNESSETQKSTINVTFDEYTTYSLDDISDELYVEIVAPDGTKRVVTPTIKSAKITDDGLYIEAVVVAEGLETTIRMPYEGEDALAIRSDLKPLYRALSSTADKYVRFNLRGGLRADEESEEKSFNFKAIANILKDDSAQFALTREEEGKTSIIAMYNDDVLTIGGRSITKAQLEEAMNSIFANVNFDELLDMLPDITYEEDDEVASATDDSVQTTGEEILVSGDDEKVEGGKRFNLAKSFVRLSSALDSAEKFFNKPLVKILVPSFVAEDGTYSMSVSSKTLLKLMGFFKSNGNELGLDKLVSFLDEQLGGIINTDNVKLTLSLVINRGTLKLEFKAEDEESGFLAYGELNIETARKAFEMPVPNATVAQQGGEVVEDNAIDLEITVPIVLPKKDLDITIKTVVHPAALFGGDFTNYVDVIVSKATDDGAATIAQFVLDKYYAYLNADGLASSFGKESLSFYEKFEIDGHSATFGEILPSIIGKVKDLSNGLGGGGIDEQGSDEPTYDQSDDDHTYEQGGDDQIIDQGESSIFDRGVSVETPYDTHGLIVPIGATEDDIRALLQVNVFDEKEEPVPYSDYTIRGFDSSASLVDYIDVVFTDTFFNTVAIVVYDPLNARETGVAIDDGYIVELGSVAEGLPSEFFPNVNYTDDVVEWTQDFPKNDSLIIKSVNGQEIDENYTFDTAGNQVLVLERVSNGEQLSTTVYVYDPENPIIVNVSCDCEHVYLKKNATEEDIRNEIGVYVIYDSYEDEEVFDYEIEGFDSDCESFEIVWGDFRCVVEVEFYEDTSYDDPTNKLKLSDYLRIEAGDGEEVSFESVLPAIKEILSKEENKALLAKAITFEKIADGYSLKVKINSADNEDVLAVLNLFLGVPTEEGFNDLDAASIAELLNGTSMIDVSAMFGKMIGVSMVDFLSELYLDSNLTWSDNLAISVVIGDRQNNQYVISGVSFSLVESIGQFKITDEMIENSLAFDSLMPTLMMRLFSLS